MTAAARRRNCQEAPPARHAPTWRPCIAVLLALGADADHVPGKPTALQGANDQGGRIELPPAEAVNRRVWKAW